MTAHAVRQVKARPSKIGHARQGRTRQGNAWQGEDGVGVSPDKACFVSPMLPSGAAWSFFSLTRRASCGSSSGGSSSSSSSNRISFSEGWRDFPRFSCGVNFAASLWGGGEAGGGGIFTSTCVHLHQRVRH